MITVIVKPAAAKNLVTQLKPDTFQIMTTALPEHNKANEKVISLLAEYLDLPKSVLTIKRGQGSKIKLIEVNE